ncbi:M23 family metallopeptidase [Photobacterium leiognathi]|uniref:M23 family metallopeptidase n=1 Tax=Photobacterium leiognathi TaxID=553611 RepID=UPI0029811466|nr:M23 family metallopeptidase [Photobacterium leiognathi]
MIHINKIKISFYSIFLFVAIFLILSMGNVKYKVLEPQFTTYISEEIGKFRSTNGDENNGISMLISEKEFHRNNKLSDIIDIKDVKFPFHYSDENNIKKITQSNGEQIIYSDFEENGNIIRTRQIKLNNKRIYRRINISEVNNFNESKKIKKQIINSFISLKKIGIKTSKTIRVVYEQKTYKDFLLGKKKITGYVLDGVGDVKLDTDGVRFNINGKKWFNKFLVPSVGDVTSHFNLHRRHPVTKKSRPHNGVDFSGKSGKEIYATHDGYVLYSSYQSTYGNFIKLKSGSIETRYAHMSKRLVKKGQYVKKGDIIGLIGSTGLSTGPHLHFELRVNGKPVDPFRLQRSY